MSATFYKAPDTNYWSTTLNGDINDSVQTITLTSVTGLNAPGVLVINRQDDTGTDTPAAREVISFTGVSGSDLTGVTRGFNDSTARAHSDGAIVEAVFTTTMWNDLRDNVAAVISTDGANIAVTGTASVAVLNADAQRGATAALTSVASVSKLSFTNAYGSAATFVTMQSMGVMASTASIGLLQYKAKKGVLVTDSDAATITFDMDAANVHTVVLGDNRTLAVSNVDVGQAFIIRLQQDATGSRTVTWWSDINWNNNTVPTLTTTANLTDSFGFLCSSSGNYDGYILGQGIPQ